MKTARFRDVVARCGRPESHLLFAPPEKDRALQAAVKQTRVLTVHREHVGTRKDFGVVGFESDAHAQYLVFPRSLKPFTGKRIIAIRYELLAEPPPGKPRRAAPQPRPAKTPARPARPAKPVRSRPPSRRPAAVTAASEPPASASHSVAPTRAPASKPAKNFAAQNYPALLRAVEAALADLETGKDVAAYKRLQAALANAHT